MSEEIMRQNMIAIAQTYASAKGQSLAYVSANIHGNQAFFADYLSARVAPTTKTYWRMINEFKEQWPEGVAWPKTLPIGVKGT